MLSSGNISIQPVRCGFWRYLPSILRWESPSELRSFSRLVTHLYARATSCLLEASTQLANRANSHTLKLNQLKIPHYKIQQVARESDSGAQELSVPLWEFFFPLFN